MIRTQRTTHASTGDLFFDTQTCRLLIYNGSTWVPVEKPSETPYEWQPYYSVRFRNSLMSGKRIRGNIFRRRRWDERAMALGITLHGYEYLDLRELFIWKLKNREGKGNGNGS